MSAEKEIVNYWCNKKGYFSINNIKTSSNKDAGILAIKFDGSSVSELLHIDVNCSITSSIAETSSLSHSATRISEDKFVNKEIAESIAVFVKNLSIEAGKIRNLLVLGSLPKSRKVEILSEFRKKNIEIMEFDNVLLEVLEQLDTHYHKNDIIRTLQLTKFLLLSEPAKMAKVLLNSKNSSSSRKEFLANILDNESIIKEFRKTNSERLTSILKNSSIKPKELAGILEHSVLNKKTRKIFMDSLMQEQKSRKSINKTNKIKKSNFQLKKFF